MKKAELQGEYIFFETIGKNLYHCAMTSALEARCEMIDRMLTNDRKWTSHQSEKAIQLYENEFKRVVISVVVILCH